MSGIVYYRTAAREEVVEFYTGGLGAEVWLEQHGATVLTYDGFRFGFRDGADPETGGTLTFVAPYRGEVDRLYDRLEPVATGEPVRNRSDATYQFLARDPEGRRVEVRTFL